MSCGQYAAFSSAVALRAVTRRCDPLISIVVSGIAWRFSHHAGGLVRPAPRGHDHVVVALLDVEQRRLARLAALAAHGVQDQDWKVLHLAAEASVGQAVDDDVGPGSRLTSFAFSVPGGGKAGGALDGIRSQSMSRSCSCLSRRLRWFELVVPGPGSGQSAGVRDVGRWRRSYVVVPREGGQQRHRRVGGALV